MDAEMKASREAKPGLGHGISWSYKHSLLAEPVHTLTKATFRGLLEVAMKSFIALVGNANVATLALGSQPRQRAYKVEGQEGSPGVTPHAPGSVGKCEGMNPHTPKATPTLGDGVPVDF
jgi:hypothetical protein